jgi:hypothetical protein
MKTFILIICLLLLTATSMTAQEKDFPKFSVLYLGQKPPGKTPEIFAPGIVSKDNRYELMTTFSSDGKECFYTKSFETNTNMTTKEINGKWKDPSIVDFSGKVLTLNRTSHRMAKK